MGTQIVGRAFVKALQQEVTASQAAARARAGTSNTSGGQTSTKDAITGMTIGEARQILNIDENADKQSIEEKYKHLFEMNERSKGGSFYLQSKVVRAKERIDQNDIEDINISTKDTKTSEEVKDKS